MRTRQAVILAGGKGTRLGALAADTPKPMLAMADGRPFLDHLIAHVARQGFDRALILAGHLGAAIKAHYAERGDVQVVIESEPLDTAGAVRGALDLLEERFLLLNGDTLLDANLRALDGVQGQAAIAVRTVDDAGRYGSVDVDATGRVVRFREKDPERAGAGLIYAGACLLRRADVAQWPTGRLSLERDILPGLAARGALFAAPCEGYFIDIGLPETLALAREGLPTLRARPTIFLDRDGVLNEDAGYTHKREDLVWVEGARAAVRLINDAGWRAIVVTNQSGVARGFYGLDDVAAFHDAMQDDLAEIGAFIDAFYLCPFHPDGLVPEFTADHPDRKPNPGMILRAMADWPIDKPRSFLVGDKASDLEAGARAGVHSIAYRGGSLAELVMEAIACAA
jgi:D,D-heptose 1,7-bisphosphate phosphatase